MQDESKNMTKQQRRKVILGALAVALVVSLVCVDWRGMGRDDLSRIMEEGRLTVIMDDSHMGFCSEHLVDTMGFYYEMVKAYTDSMGLELEVVVVDGLDNQLKSLSQGAGHLVAATIPLTEPIRRKYEAVGPLYYAHLCLAQHDAKDKLNSPLEMANRLVVMPENSAYEMRLDFLGEEIADSIPRFVINACSEEDLLYMLQRGDIAYTMCMSLDARCWKHFFPKTDFDLALGVDQPCGWVVSKSAHKLHQSLEDFFERFMQTSDYRRIYLKYF